MSTSNTAAQPARIPLPAGSEIDYIGVRATVVADDGGPTLLVDHEGDRQEWAWELEGASCTIVSTAAEAEGSLVALGRWASIDSAPRDGSRVILFREGYAEDLAICWWDGSREDWEAVHGSAFPGATHWMRTPEGPKAPQ